MNYQLEYGEIPDQYCYGVGTRKSRAYPYKKYIIDDYKFVNSIDGQPREICFARTHLVYNTTMLPLLFGARLGR